MQPDWVNGPLGTSSEDTKGTERPDSRGLSRRLCLGAEDLDSIPGATAVPRVFIVEKEMTEGLS